jgi:hypothetical protein
MTVITMAIHILKCLARLQLAKLKGHWQSIQAEVAKQLKHWVMDGHVLGPHTQIWELLCKHSESDVVFTVRPVTGSQATILSGHGKENTLSRTGRTDAAGTATSALTRKLEKIASAIQAQKAESPKVGQRSV